MVRVVVARYKGDPYEEYLKPCLDKNVTPIYEIWNEDATGLFAKYNLAITRMIDDGLKDHDIILFAHGDVSIVDPFYIEKLEYFFQKVPNVSIAGVIGTTLLTENGGWHMCPPEYHRGQWIQENTPPSGQTTTQQRVLGNHDDLAVVDGMFFAVRGSYLKENRFDYKTYGDVYHFYDLDFCLEAIQNGFKIGVVDILVKHKSAGGYDATWGEVKEVFLNKWKNRGVEFPLTVTLENKPK